MTRGNPCRATPDLDEFRGDGSGITVSESVVPTGETVTAVEARNLYRRADRRIQQLAKESA